MMFKADLFVKHVEIGLLQKWAQQNIFAQYTSEDISFCLFFLLFISFHLGPFDLNIYFLSLIHIS